MSSLLYNILLHKCTICYFEVTSNSEIVIRNCRREITNYHSTNSSEEMKINPIFQRPLSQHHHHLPTAPAWVRNGQPPSFQQSTQPLFIWVSPQRPSTMKKHIVPCREGCRLYQPYHTAGTAKDTLLHLCLLQEREELLYFSYVNIDVKAPASQLIVTPKHCVNHLHRSPQTKLGITGRPVSLL